MITKYSMSYRFINSILELVTYVIIKFTKIKISFENDDFNVLLIEPFQMGDVVSLSVMLSPLKKKFPQSNIYILTKPSNKQIFKNDARIREVLTADFPWTDHGSKRYGVLKRWIVLFQDLKSLRKINFSIGIDTRGDIRSQIVLNIINCKHKVGYNRNTGSNLKNWGLLLDSTFEYNSKYLHRYESNTYLLKSLNFEENELFPIIFPSINVRSELRINSKDYILLHIGSGWEYKRWKNENWLELINYITQNTSLNVHIVAGENEKSILDDILYNVKDINRCFPLITTYIELLREIMNCKLFIGLDSGPMHIADCLDKPVLALFGPGNSVIWKPYSKISSYKHNIESFNCHPCFQKKCIHIGNNCMDKIGVFEIQQLFDSIYKELS